MSQGRIIHGTLRPRDRLSQGRIVHGTHRYKKMRKLSHGGNVQGADRPGTQFYLLISTFLMPLSCLLAAVSSLDKCMISMGTERNREEGDGLYFYCKNRSKRKVKVKLSNKC
jgi:hypothetical protein